LTPTDITKMKDLYSSLGFKYINQYSRNPYEKNKMILYCNTNIININTDNTNFNIINKIDEKIKS